MKGYIRLFRKLVDWEWYDDVVVKAVFIDLLINANFKEKKWQGQVVEPGQFVTSISSIATRNGLSVQQVRTALNKLKKTGEINKHSTNKNTVIIVLNYRRYQELNDCENEDCNKQITNNPQSSNNQVTTTNNGKNDKNGKNEKKSRGQTEFAKPSLDELQQFISENKLNVDAQSFVDYYNSNGWRVGKNPMKDWRATCRNWSRRESKNQKKQDIDSTYDINDLARKAMFNDDYEV